MPTVRLLRRLGQNNPGTEITATDTQAQWLTMRSLAVLVTESPAEQRAPGQAHEDTPDPATASLAELRAQAEDLGLPTYGTKAQLAARIAEHT